MADAPGQVKKVDRYPYGWWLVFGSKSRTKKRPKAEEKPIVENKPEATPEPPKPPDPAPVPEPPKPTSGPPAAAPPTPVESTPSPASSSGSSEPSSPTRSESSSSSKKKVRFQDDTGSPSSSPKTKQKTVRFRDPPSSSSDFETLSAASDDSNTDIPFVPTQQPSSPRQTTPSETDMRKTYILRPNAEHFHPGEPRVLLILKGEKALREAKRALRNGTWRQKYTESQTYKILE